MILWLKQRHLLAEKLCNGCPVGVHLKMNKENLIAFLLQDDYLRTTVVAFLPKVCDE